MRYSRLIFIVFLSLITFISNAQETSRLPKELMGNWFLANGNRSWKVGFYEDRVAYDSEVWEYGSIHTNKKITSINLKEGTHNALLELQINEAGKLILFSGKNKIFLSRSPGGKRKFSQAENELTSKIFKTDTATYAGIIRNFTVGLGFNTGQLLASNLITGATDSYLINIKSDGTFKVRVPMNYPLECMVQFPFQTMYIILEPGMKTFQLFDLKISNSTNLFMGAGSAVNTDLAALKSTMIHNWMLIDKDIHDFNASQYKAYFLKLQKQRLLGIKKYKDTAGMSKLSEKQLSQNIKFSIANNLLDIGHTLGMARNKAGTLPTLNQLAFGDAYPMTLPYMDFMRDLPFGDNHSVTSNDYFILLKRIDNLDLMRKKVVLARYQVYAKELEKKQDLKPSEKSILKTLNNIVTQGINDQNLKAYLNQWAVMDTFSIGRVDEFKSKFVQQENENRRRVLFELTGKDLAFEQEILNAQANTSTGKFSDFKILDTAELINLKKEFTFTEIYGILSSYNYGLAKLIEDNKLKIGYTNNESPKTQGDLVFDEIIGKYRNKVIYVDFWATWCSPCRDAIRLIAPIKEELKNEEIVFLYISDESSPTNTYNSVIPNIKGEHYRLGSDQYNHLKQKFKITGIPHYALVDNKGRIVSTDFQLHDQQLKTKLLELAKE
jgi:thiol-disulfide isomerase/thioredoxin